MRLVGAGQDPDEVAEGFLMLGVRQRDEVAGEFQQQALPRRRLEVPVAVHALEKVGYVDPQRMRERVEAAGSYPVDALLVFVRLLRGHTDQFGQLLLGEADCDASLAHPGTDVPIDVLYAGAARPSLLFG